MSETTFNTNEVGATPRTPPPLTLTILVHPDIERLGQQCLLEGEGPHSISRKDACFAHPGGPAHALDERHVSRRPVRVRADPTGALVTSENSKARLEGVPLDLVGIGLDAEALERGVSLALSGRVTLLLRRARPASARVELDMVGLSPEHQELRERIRQLAPGDQPVLIQGPTGAGKELVARALHSQSKRADRPWVALNLAAISPSTAASQLFGHARGAFTGAQSSSAGLFGAASTGTLFLDEIGEAPGEVQPLLLRALESGELQVVGAGTRTVDVRVIAATDADLDQAIASGRLRPALYHRLAGASIVLEPLCQRREDIAAQLRHFMLEELRALGCEELRERGWLSPDIQRALIFHDWPGNTRQLARTVEAMVIEDHRREFARLPATIAVVAASPSDSSASLSSPERAPPVSTVPSFEQKPSASVGEDHLDASALTHALAANDYKLSPTAKALGIALNTLKLAMKTHGLRRAQELEAADIEAARACVGDNPKALAQELRVSAHGLRLRLRELE